ncbi:MAG TPA: hypothetical protein GXZ86_07735 [Clostridiales bacterium]|nr:hypothetical protein [Clostridiales bacterium]
MLYPTELQAHRRLGVTHNRCGSDSVPADGFKYYHKPPPLSTLDFVIEPTIEEFFE